MKIKYYYYNIFKKLSTIKIIPKICLLFKMKDSVFFKIKGMNLNVNHAVLQAYLQ